MERKRIYRTSYMGSRKPLYRTEEPVFFRCDVCGAIVVKHHPSGSKMDEKDSFYAGECCGHTMKQLVPERDGQMMEDHKMDFVVFGGFDHNTIRIEVAEGYHSMDEAHHIEWIYLHTFQGGQMKYLYRKSDSSAQFSLADEDAFVFCGRDICENCRYQCKRGHTAYAYCSQHGLYELRL